MVATPGVYAASLDEFVQQVDYRSHVACKWVSKVDGERGYAAGVDRIVLNGSFVTDIMDPNDVDCVLLVGPGYPADPAAEEELDKGLPFLDIAIVGQEDYDRFVARIFAAGRLGVPKGMIEVIL
jgi:hypothetical protein